MYDLHNPQRRRIPVPEVAYEPHMPRPPTSARWRRLALAVGLALGLAAISGAAQGLRILTNGRNLQIPINHGLPDIPRQATPADPGARLVAESRRTAAAGCCVGQSVSRTYAAEPALSRSCAVC